MKNLIKGMAVLSILSNVYGVSAFLNWDYRGSGTGDSGTGANSATATYIGNGSGINEWTVPSGANSAATSPPGVISNTFNSTALTGGYNVTVSVDSSTQTMGWQETYPTGGGTGYLQDFAAVSPYLDGASGASSDDSLSLRLDSTSGTVPAGNSAVAVADLISGASVYTDLVAEVITLRIDAVNSAMFSADFNIYEIELLSGQLPGGDGDNNWDHESVVVTGYTATGAAVLPTLTQLDPASGVAPTISGNRAIAEGGGSHNDPDTGINVQFDSTHLDYIDITYELRRRSDVGGYSFGLGLGDITYEIVPEPSTTLLFALVSPLILIRRRGRA